MKKMLSIIATLALSTSTVIPMVSIVNDQQTNLNNDFIGNSLDWNKIQLDLQNELEEIKPSNNAQTINENDNSFTEEMYYKIQNDALNYFDEVKDFNNINDVLSKLFELSEDFKLNFENELNSTETINEDMLYKTQKNNLTQIIYNGNEEVAKGKFEKSKEQKILAQTSAVVASGAAIVSGILASTYWANAWFFGISIPAAIAATAVTVALTTYSIWVENWINDTTPIIGTIQKIINNGFEITDGFEFFDAWDIFVGSLSIYKYFAAGTMAAATVGAWASPTTFGVIALISTILTLVVIIME